MAGSQELTQEAAKEFTENYLKEAMQIAMEKAGASPQLIDISVFVVENSLAYAAFCATQRKKPDDPMALAAFLESKGKGVLKVAGNDDLKCAIALWDFGKGLYTRGKFLRGGPVPATIVASLTLIDLLGVGNSCSFVQEAFYHGVLETSSPKRVPVARATRRTEAEPKAPERSGVEQITQPQTGKHMKAEKDAIMCTVVPMMSTP